MPKVLLGALRVIVRWSLLENGARGHAAWNVNIYQKL